MTKPTLTYFDFAGGRGEASRLALHIAGVDWEDDRFSGDWAGYKPQTPFGALPVLKVAGRGELSQSNAILGYLGRTYGLLPEDEWEAARHVAVMNAVEELRAQAAMTADDDEDEKRRKREAYAAGYLQAWLRHLSAQIEGPFIGSELSVADLKVYVALRSYSKGVYDYIPTDVLDDHPQVVALCAAVAADPRVTAWYAD